MRRICPELVEQAIAEGIITFEEYEKIPWRERESMACLFSRDGREAVKDGVITLEQYLQIPKSERESMKYIFSPDGRQALRGGIITLEQYLKIPSRKRKSMPCLFRYYDRQAVKDGVITLKQYLKIPSRELESMTCLFYPDGRQALKDRVITLEQYLKIPSRKRGSMACLFSPDGRQAVKDGVITLERYLNIPWDERYIMRYIFSPDGRQALDEGIITLNQYLQIPWSERKNAMTALRDPDTRQRIINGEITIENIIGVHYHADGAAAPNINKEQSTHTASVHKAVSESATQLAKLYKSSIEGAGLETVIENVRGYIDLLPKECLKNQAARRGFLRIVEPSYTFTDIVSQVTIRQLLALAFLAMHDDKKRVGSLEDAKMQFVEGLYEIQRGYNLSELGIDEGGEDKHICSNGTFNKLIEKLQGIHPDCVVLYITEGTASTKLPAVVREEAMQYLETFAKPNTAEVLLKFTRLMAEVKKDGVEMIWDNIKDPIATRMWDEFGSLYRDRTDLRFTELVEAGKDAEFDLSTLQKKVESYYINLQLDELKNKAKNLCDPNYTQASEQATTIVNKLCNLLFFKMTHSSDETRRARSANPRSPR